MIDAWNKTAISAVQIHSNKSNQTPTWQQQCCLVNDADVIVVMTKAMAHKSMKSDESTSLMLADMMAVKFCRPAHSSAANQNFLVILLRSMV